MIRPVSFGFNEQTAGSNVFQNRSLEEQNVQQKALAEFDAFADKLRENGLDVTVVNDTVEPHTPDSIFPNNWVSFHENGQIFLYPMQAENRRLERRLDIINDLKDKFIINEIIDLSYFEKEGKFLEGTGSMVLDRQNQITYTSFSPRTDLGPLCEFWAKSGYSGEIFSAESKDGIEIYHTNVLMCVGQKFAVICLDVIPDEADRADVTVLLVETGKEIITINEQQMNAFAGNMLELENDKGEHLLVMSASAYHSLLPEQIQRFEKYCKLVYADLKTIETIGGGSARCMIAEVFLPLRI
jgi:hypothetical protein